VLCASKAKNCEQNTYKFLVELHHFPVILSVAMMSLAPYGWSHQYLHIYIYIYIYTCLILFVCEVETLIFFSGQKETAAIRPAVFNHALIDSKDVNEEYEFPTSCLQQFIILLRRLFLQQKRNFVSL